VHDFGLDSREVGQFFFESPLEHYTNFAGSEDPRELKRLETPDYLNNLETAYVGGTRTRSDTVFLTRNYSVTRIAIIPLGHQKFS
jgi:hypothetical protein